MRIRIGIGNRDRDRDRDRNGIRRGSGGPSRRCLIPDHSVRLRPPLPRARRGGVGADHRALRRAVGPGASDLLHDLHLEARASVHAPANDPLARLEGDPAAPLPTREGRASRACLPARSGRGRRGTHCTGVGGGEGAEPRVRGGARRRERNRRGRRGSRRARGGGAGDGGFGRRVAGRDEPQQRQRRGRSGCSRHRRQHSGIWRTRMNSSSRGPTGSPSSRSASPSTPTAPTTIRLNERARLPRQLDAARRSLGRSTLREQSGRPWKPGGRPGATRWARLFPEPG
jgi:hypothetical protein